MRFPLAGDINWMETPLQLIGKCVRFQGGFPLAGDINWMETEINLNRTDNASIPFPLAGDINWMET